MNKFYEDLDIDDFFPQYEAECQGCDMWGPVNDIGLCTDCAGKLERDMIRQRDWAYFTLAFGCPKDKDEDCNLKMLIYDWPEFGHWVDVTAINGNTMTIQDYSVNAKVTYNPSNGSVDFFLPKILRWPARIFNGNDKVADDDPFEIVIFTVVCECDISSGKEKLPNKTRSGKTLKP